jgi:hypothetical protein
MEEFHGRDLIHNYVFNSGFYSKYLISIIHPDGIKIDGLSSAPTSLGFSSQYGGNAVGDAMKSAVEGAAGGVEKMTGLPSGSIGTIANVGKSVAGFGSQTLNDTITKYESSPSVPLSVDLFIMKEFTPSKSYAKIIEDSLKLTCPATVEMTHIQAPMKYAPNDAAGKDAVSPANTCTIVIGEHLEITHMICENFTYSPSQQLREDGSPVYIKCTYAFKTGRALDYTEYFKWFKKL